MDAKLQEALEPLGHNIARWGKLSKEGLPIPCRCPYCQSRKTVLAAYKGGSKTVECEGCYQVILEYPRNWKPYRRP